MSHYGEDENNDRFMATSFQLYILSKSINLIMGRAAINFNVQYLPVTFICTKLLMSPIN